MESYAYGPRKEQRCPDCGGMDFVEDHAAGDVVCRNCGLVVEAHIIDERSEWRTFGDKDKEGDDPSRVGGPTNALFADGGLSTTIGKVQGDGGASFSLTRLQNRQVTSTERNLQTAVRTMNGIGERLGLVDSIKTRAAQVFQEVQDNKQLKGRGASAIYAACIYVACRQENKPRTFKEICAVMPGVPKKDIGRCYSIIVQLYQAKAQAKDGAAGGSGKAAGGAGGSGKGSGPAVGGVAMNPVDVMRRFTSNLGFDKASMHACVRTATRAVELEAGVVPWSGKNPTTVAAMIIYGVNWLNKIKGAPESDIRSLTEISQKSGMAPTTIRDSFREMVPFFVSGALLRPESFATKEQLLELQQQVEKDMERGKGTKRTAEAAGIGATAD